MNKELFIIGIVLMGILNINFLNESNKQNNSIEKKLISLESLEKLENHKIELTDKKNKEILLNKIIKEGDKTSKDKVEIIKLQLQNQLQKGSILAKLEIDEWNEVEGKIKFVSGLDKKGDKLLRYLPPMIAALIGLMIFCSIFRIK